jgi:hypothetical protein
MKVSGVNLPSTLERSSAKAQRLYAKVLRHAEQEYGKGQRAGRTAYGALKNSFEKVGDHWEPKGRTGPSDPHSKKPRKAKRSGKGASYGGVDVEGHTRAELLDRARELGMSGVSRMTKAELARAIDGEQRKMSRSAKSKSKSKSKSK